MADLPFYTRYVPQSRNSTVFTTLALTAVLAVGGMVFFTEYRNAAAEPTPAQEAVKPEIYKEVVYGHSVQGKEIKGYEFGNTSTSSKGLLIFSTIHGNEIGGEDLLERLVIEMRQNPDKISKDKKIIIIPIANPDGFYDRTDKLNANGVNLNLNFETAAWKDYGPEGTYAGPAPFSEPESRLIKDIVEKNNVFQMVSFHSFGSLSIPENNQPSIDLAEWYAEKTGYKLTGADTTDTLGNNYPGTATGWFAEKTGNAAITVELTDHFSNDWHKNKEALMEMISS